jgi:hypothetical protein
MTNTWSRVMRGLFCVGIGWAIQTVRGVDKEILLCYIIYQES